MLDLIVDYPDRDSRHRSRRECILKNVVFQIIEKKRITNKRPKIGDFLKKFKLCNKKK
jgi:hypothetical protein